MSRESFGRYEIKTELARGGMATVYHAYDPRVRREVAVKVLPREFLHDPTFRARFEREAEAIVTLEHPAIVPVYDYGDEDGQPYLVMRYMAGGSLSDRVKSGALSLEEVARIIEQLAPALDNAHAKGFIHRDLKPDNILFDTGGNAFIADFGIARMAQSVKTLTDSGAIIGTPAYMSPEQIGGEGEVDRRSDLYSLGVIVFQMLTGRPPYAASTPAQLFTAHLHKPPPNVLSFNPDLPRACVGIILRAMAKDPDARYRTAGELASDLQAAGAGEPVSPVTSEWATMQTVPRKQIPAWGWALLGLFVAALVIGGLTLGSMLPGMGTETQVVTVEVSVTPVPTDAPTGTLAPTITPLPTPTILPPGDLGRIAFASDRDGDFEIYIMRPNGEDQTRLTMNPADDTEPSWSPDGMQIAFVSDRDGNNEIYIMDTDGYNVTRLTDNPANDTMPDWSPDGTRIAFVSERDGNKEIYVMDVDGGSPIRLTDEPAHDVSPDWSPDSTQIVFSSTRTGGSDIYVIDADGQNLTRLTREAEEYDEYPVWSPDGTRIAFLRAFASFTMNQKGIIVMNANGTKQTEVKISGGGGPFIYGLCWSPDGTWFAYAKRYGYHGRRLIHVINVNGEHQNALARRTQGLNHQPDWGP